MTHPQQPDVGIKTAVDVANRALERVPAYRTFLKQNGIDVDGVDANNFGVLPPMMKDNYMLRYRTADLVWDGDLGDVVNWSASSGSTGEPTYWPRSRRSLYDSIGFHEQILRESFDAHTQTTLVVNTFAMGNWIGGTYTLLAINGTNDLDMPVSIISPGIKIDEAARAIAELGRDYDQVIVAGYPPKVRDVLSQVPADIIASQTVKLLLAGERITERWRTEMLRHINRSDDPRSITLIYGTADAGMMGFETPTSIAIRRAADDDPVLARSLFGKDVTWLPTLACYNPVARYVETDEDGFLLFTVDSTLPLVRYRIKDYGDLFDADRLRHILTACGKTDLAEHVSPTSHFVSVEGRADVALTLSGLNIFRENLIAAVLDPRVFDLVTEQFCVPEPEQDDLTQRFVIDVELARGVDPSEGLRDTLTNVFVETLRSVNGEYNTQYQQDPEGSTPDVVLTEYESRAEYGVKRKVVKTR